MTAVLIKGKLIKNTDHRILLKTVGADFLTHDVEVGLRRCNRRLHRYPAMIQIFRGEA